MSTSTLFIQLDAEYDTDDRILEAGPLAELLYIRALAFCKRKLTDGEITEAQLKVLAHGITKPLQRAQSLVESQLWEKTEHGWRIARWHKYNRSADDVKLQRKIASEAGTRGNHDRWHVGPEGKPSPKCPICRAEHIGLPDRVNVGGANRVRSPEEETEAETEAEAETITPSSYEEHPPSPVGGDGGKIETIVQEAAKRYARTEAQNGSAKSEAGLARWKAKQLTDERTPAIRQALEQHPDAPISALADHALGLPRALDAYRPTGPPDDPEGPRLTPDQIRQLVTPTPEDK